MNNKERNMYEYGYMGGMVPQQMPQQMPYQPMNIPQGYNQYGSDQNHIEQRITNIEKQVKRLEQRLSLIENPYQKSNNFSEPDSNMYML